MCSAAQGQVMDLPAPPSLALLAGIRGHLQLPPWPWPWLCTATKSKMQGKCLHCTSLRRAKDLLHSWLLTSFHLQYCKI